MHARLESPKFIPLQKPHTVILVSSPLASLVNTVHYCIIIHIISM